MNTELQPCSYETARKIIVDNDTIKMLEKLTGLEMGVYLLKK